MAHSLFYIGTANFKITGAMQLTLFWD